jgi:hypothetical protein
MESTLNAVAESNGQKIISAGEINVLTLTDFLSAFFPDETEPIHLRAFPPKGGSGAAIKIATSRRQLSTDRNQQHKLKTLNQTSGIYFVVNSGGDTDDEINRVNAFFAEIDDVPIEEQHAIYDAAPILPSIRVQTRKSVHAYWLLRDTCDIEKWCTVQESLIDYFKSDSHIKNPSRVMRLPFFNHLSLEESGKLLLKRVELIKFDQDRRYTVEQMCAAFSPVKEIPTEQQSPNVEILDSPTYEGSGTFQSWDELNGELRGRILAHPTTTIDKKREWARLKGICHNGKGNSALGLHLATGAYHCKSGCSTGEILEAFNLPAEPNGKLKVANEVLTISRPQPKAEVFYGLAGDVVRSVEPHTESDPMAILIQLLALFGNVIGRNAYFPVEAAKHFLNIFTVLVGDSSKGRKGTSYELVKSLFDYVDPAWSSNNQSSGLSSGEGLIYAVRDSMEKSEPIKEKGRVTSVQKVIADEGVGDKRLVVIEPEFAQPLKVAGREGNTLSTLIRQAWDSGRLRVMTKNQPLRATDAHISIVGHITKDELLRDLKTVDTSNGFANRFLWVYVRRSKLLPEGGGFHRTDRMALINRLRQAVEFASTVREMRRDEEARALWSEFYAAEAEGKPGLVGSVTSRAEAQVVRLSCLYALLDRSEVVRCVHLEAAIALWKYCEDSARFIFGELPVDNLVNKILGALREAEYGLTRTEIRDLLGRNRKTYEIDNALQTLLRADLAHPVTEHSDRRGRPTERWLAKQAPSPEPETSLM